MDIMAAKAETMTFLKALICSNTKYEEKKYIHYFRFSFFKRVERIPLKFTVPSQSKSKFMLTLQDNFLVLHDN